MLKRVLRDSCHSAFGSSVFLTLIAKNDFLKVDAYLL